MSIVSPKNFKLCTVVIFLLPNDTCILSSLFVLVKNCKKKKNDSVELCEAVRSVVDVYQLIFVPQKYFVTSLLIGLFGNYNVFIQIR